VKETVAEIRAGSSVGFDFGLKKFLVGSDGSVHLSPLFFKQNLKEVRRANRDLSKKKKGSHNRERARLHLARVHISRRPANATNGSKEPSSGAGGYALSVV